MWNRKVLFVCISMVGTLPAQDVSDLYRKAEAAYYVEKNAAKAEAYLDTASLEIRQAGSGLAEYAPEACGLYLRMGLSEKSDSLIQAAIEATRREKAQRKTRDLLAWMGWVALGTRQYEKSSRALKEAISIVETEKGDEATRELILLLPQLASAEDELGHVREAEELLLRQGRQPWHVACTTPCVPCDPPMMPGREPYPYSLFAFYERHQRPKDEEALLREMASRYAHGSIGERYGTLSDLARFLEHHDRGAEAKEVRRALVAALESSALDGDRACAAQIRRISSSSGPH